MICKYLSYKNVNILSTMSRQMYNYVLEYKKNNYMLSIKKLVYYGIPIIKDTKYTEFKYVNFSCVNYCKQNEALGYMKNINGIIVDKISKNNKIFVVSRNFNPTKIFYTGNSTKHIYKLSKNFPNLKSFTFHYYYNNSINKCWNFKNLKKITFQGKFDQDISDLPLICPNLETLILSYNFCELVDNFKGKLLKLKKLVFGTHFNNNIDSLINICPNLEYLDLGYSFNQPLDGLIGGFPELKILICGSYFNENLGILANSFPKLQKLKICNHDIYDSNLNININNNDVYNNNLNIKEFIVGRSNLCIEYVDY